MNVVDQLKTNQCHNVGTQDVVPSIEQNWMFMYSGEEDEGGGGRVGFEL